MISEDIRHLATTLEDGLWESQPAALLVASEQLRDCAESVRAAVEAAYPGQAREENDARYLVLEAQCLDALSYSLVGLAADADVRTPAGAVRARKAGVIALTVSELRGTAEEIEILEATLVPEAARLGAPRDNVVVLNDRRQPARVAEPGGGTAA